MKTTDWKIVTDPSDLARGARPERMRVRYGMHLVRGNPEPYFSITAEMQERGDSGDWIDSSGGCLHAEVREHFPELAPLIRWHLFMPEAGPFHYTANATFFWGQDEMGHFKAHVLLGEVPEWDDAGPFSLLVDKADVEAWCLKRLPALRERFLAAMEAAGVKLTV